MGIFCELAILYNRYVAHLYTCSQLNTCRYKPVKLNEHLESFWSRVNIPMWAVTQPSRSFDTPASRGLQRTALAGPR